MLRAAAAAYLMLPLKRISETSRDRFIGYVILAMFSGLFMLDTKWSRMILYFGFLPAMILAFDWRTMPKFSESHLFRFVVAYFVIGLTTFYWRDQLSPVVFEDMARFLNLGLALVVSITIFSRHPDWIGPIYRTIGVVAAFSVLLAIALYWQEIAEGWRLQGVSRINSNLLASSLGAGALGVMFVVLPAQPDNQKRYLWYGTIILVVLGLWLTGSRGPLLAFALASIIGVSLYSPKVGLLAALGTILLAGTVAVSGFIDLDVLLQRGDSYRLALWSEGFQLAIDRPWFGYGFGARLELGSEVGIRSTKPHNVFISHLLLGGVIWLGTFVALVVGALMEAWRQQRDGQKGPLVLLIFALSCMMVDFHTVILNLSAEWLIFWTPVTILTAAQLRNDGDATRRERLYLSA